MHRSRAPLSNLRDARRQPISHHDLSNDQGSPESESVNLRINPVRPRCRLPATGCGFSRTRLCGGEPENLRFLRVRDDVKRRCRTCFRERSHPCPERPAASMVLRRRNPNSLLAPNRIHSERLVVSGPGIAFLSRVCGFLQGERPATRLIRVEEDGIEVQIGPTSWWGAWVARHPRFRLRIDIPPAAAGPALFDANGSGLTVDLRLDVLGKRSEATDGAAWKLLWRLRSHLLAVAN